MRKKLEYPPPTGIYTRTHVHEIVYYEQPNAQTSLCIHAVSPGPLLLSYTMQMDGGIEVSLHKIYVSISVLNKTCEYATSTKVSCSGPYLEH